MIKLPRGSDDMYGPPQVVVKKRVAEWFGLRNASLGWIGNTKLSSFSHFRIPTFSQPLFDLPNTIVSKKFQTEIHFDRCLQLFEIGDFFLVYFKSLVANIVKNFFVCEETKYSSFKVIKSAYPYCKISMLFVSLRIE